MQKMSSKCSVKFFQRFWWLELGKGIVWPDDSDCKDRKSVV